MQTHKQLYLWSWVVRLVPCLLLTLLPLCNLQANAQSTVYSVLSPDQSASSLANLSGVIAYEANGEIHLRDLPNLNNERIVATAWRPIFAPDGQRVYYFSTSKQGIYSNGLDGNDEQLYYRASGAPAALFDLAADGNYFVASRHTPYIECTTTEPLVRQLSPGQNVWANNSAVARQLALSPNHRWLVYVSAGVCVPNLFAQPYDPPNFKMVNLLSKTDYTLQGVDYHDPDFAPDSNWLVFTAPDSGQQEVWKAFLEQNGTLSQATQLTAGDVNMPAAGPRWSSDGQWIIFSRDLDPGAGEDWRLFIMDTTGNQLQPLNIAGEHPAWAGGGSTATPTPANTPTPAPARGAARLYLPLIRR